MIESFKVVALKITMAESASLSSHARKKLPSRCIFTFCDIHISKKTSTPHTAHLTITDILI